MINTNLNYQKQLDIDDCLISCVCSILGIDLETAPIFRLIDGEEFWNKFDLWLYLYGYQKILVQGISSLRDLPLKIANVYVDENKKNLHAILLGENLKVIFNPSKDYKSGYREDEIIDEERIHSYIFLCPAVTPDYLLTHKHYAVLAEIAILTFCKRNGIQYEDIQYKHLDKKYISLAVTHCIVYCVNSINRILQDDNGINFYIDVVLKNFFVTYKEECLDVSNNRNYIKM